MKNFFCGKNILITGHTGFQGAWLARILVRWGAQVFGYGLQPHTAPSLSDIFRLEENTESVIGDIRDICFLQQIINRVKPDIIFHLAAQAIVREGYYDPIGTHSTNVLGTANILEAVRMSEHPVRTIVVVTTDKVYSNKERHVAYTETDPLGGYDPYSASKAAADIVTSSYCSSFFNPDMYGKTHTTIVSTARSGNVIGGGDWAPFRLVPDIIKAWYELQTPVALRHPESIRPWQHVFEPLYGYLLLAQRGYVGDTTASGAWNFGPEYSDARSVLDLVMEMQNSISSGEYCLEVVDTLHEAGILMIDSSKARHYLGWQQKFSFKQAVQTTAEWYKHYYMYPQDGDIYSDRDIDRYFGA